MAEQVRKILVLFKHLEKLFPCNRLDPEELAVKVFKGSITSDGLAEDEINVGCYLFMPIKS